MAVETVPPAPPIRVQEFREHRLRVPIKGSLTDEHTDRPLTESVASQLNGWLSRAEHLVLAPNVEHNTLALPDGSQMIALCYLLMTANKSDAVQAMYGV